MDRRGYVVSRYAKVVFFSQSQSISQLLDFQGYAWKVGYCPVCGEPIGWLWSSGEKGVSFFGLRLDKILDWSDWVLGPSIRLPGLIWG